MKLLEQCWILPQTHATHGADQEATVLAKHDDYYYGVVTHRRPDDVDWTEMCRWNVDGREVDSAGAVYTSDSYQNGNDLLDPLAASDTAFEKLDPFIKQACELIWAGAMAQGKKIAGIRAIREIVDPIPSLTDAKRWYEHTIPNRTSSHYNDDGKTLGEILADALALNRAA